jgi:hypothetical protein
MGKTGGGPTAQTQNLNPTQVEYGILFYCASDSAFLWILAWNVGYCSVSCGRFITTALFIKSYFKSTDVFST